MHSARLVSPSLTWLDLKLAERLGVRPLDQLQLAREQVGGLVLLVVVLEGKRLAGVDDEDLAGVVIGLGPPELVSPRLVDSRWFPRRHRGGTVSAVAGRFPPVARIDPVEQRRIPLYGYLPSILGRVLQRARGRGRPETQHRRLLALLCAVFTLLVAGAATADPLPPFDGAMSFREIKGPSDPQDFSWQVILSKDQALEQLDDQTALVYYERDHEPAFTITAELAHDSLGTNVPTTLSVSEGDVITLTVHHRDGNPLASGMPFAYPILAGAGWEGGFQTVVVTGPPDEAELQALRELHEREAREVAPHQEEAEKTCIVPRLKGKSLKAAKTQLSLAHCRPGALIAKHGKHLSSARVIREHPRSGAVLSPSSAVDLTLG
jgi:hypothetical protein